MKFSRLLFMFGVTFAVVNAAAAGDKFYQPAEYRTNLQAVELDGKATALKTMTSTLKMSEKYPFTIPAGQLVADAAALRSATMVIRAGFTGKVLSAMTLDVSANSWVLPYLDRGFYWLELNTYDISGKSKRRQLAFNVLEENVPKAMRKLPVIDANVFFADSSGDGSLQLHGICNDGKLTVSATRFTGGQVFNKEYDVKKGASCVMVPELRDGEFVIYTLEYITGNSSAPLQTQCAAARPGVFPATHDDYSHYQSPANESEFWVEEFQTLLGSFSDNQRGLEALASGFKSRGSDLVNISIRWNLIEPISGSYDFRELDKYVKFLSDKGIPFGITVAHPVFDGTPLDIWGEWMLDNNGDARLWRNLCVTSPASPKFRTAAKGMIAAIFARYHDNRLFKAWAFCCQGVDSGIYLDHFDRITDYSPWFIAEFIKLLEDRYGTVERLNQSWGTAFAAFAEVTPPLPDFSVEVQNTPAWRDFTAAKLKVYGDVGPRLYDAKVRQLDDTRIISNYMTFTGPIEYLFEDMIKYRSNLSDGGGESHQMARLYSIAKNWNIRLRPESHNVPAEKRLQFQDLVYNSLRYGLAGFDFGMVWNTSVNLHAGAYLKNENLRDSMAFWTGILPLLREMANTRAITPPMGFILSWDDLFYRTRAWRWYAIPGNDIQQAAAELSLGNVPYLSGITPEKHFMDKRLLVVSGENRVFSRELLEKLQKFVRNGGIVALFDDAGKYTVGETEDYAWRDFWGLPRPEGGSEMKEYKYGSGKVIHIPGAINAKMLKLILERAEIKPLVTSDNPAVEAIMLSGKNGKYLVVSAFNGLDKLRRIKDFTKNKANIRLMTLTPDTLQLRRLYPNSETADTLTDGVLTVEIEPSGLQIYKIEKLNQ